ncbi:amidohydrolase family protein [Gleimia hominis]|uniref:Amidohydrolase family protein n=1 Tax=Gleimia hominis TaxID=595468 RepID=A0ABU3IBA2_9ACTO|nr:amidohydrolase family protein [Gleimia hominis]MDT3767655.1 amidohydrolase family protein [Gleimia hominis]
MYYLGKVFNANGEIQAQGIQVEEGKVTRLLSKRDADQIRRQEASEDAETAAFITPGLVDLHCHGGGGYAFPDNYAPEQIETAILTHRKRGTTAMFASLVSLADPMPQIEALLPFCESGDLAGIHLEGPYVSKAKCGAQNPDVIRAVDRGELEHWLKAAGGYIKTITIAPEAEGALDALPVLAAYGAKPSWGHTSGTGAQAAAALEATVRAYDAHGQASGEAAPGHGTAETAQDAPDMPHCSDMRAGDPAQTVTHLFNGMIAVTHRAPGPVREFVQAARVGTTVCEMIADGQHLNLDLVEDLVEYLDDPHRAGALFVTDAIGAAGMGEGRYTLGGLEVEVKDGACWLVHKDSLAGGASLLADQFHLIASRGRIPLEAIIRATIGTPIRGGSVWDAPGVTTEFKPGQRANLIAWNEEYAPQTVIREGTKVQ